MIEAAVSAVLAVIGLVVWLVKLEAKANRNTEMIIDMHVQLRDHLDKCEDSQERIINTLIEIKETLRK